jgi:hypothetical protein
MDEVRDWLGEYSAEINSDALIQSDVAKHQLATSLGKLWRNPKVLVKPRHDVNHKTLVKRLQDIEPAMAKYRSGLSSIISEYSDRWDAQQFAPAVDEGPRFLVVAAFRNDGSRPTEPVFVAVLEQFRSRPPLPAAWKIDTPLSTYIGRGTGCELQALAWEPDTPQAVEVRNFAVAAMKKYLVQDLYLEYMLPLDYGHEVGFIVEDYFAP